MIAINPVNQFPHKVFSINEANHMAELLEKDDPYAEYKVNVSPNGLDKAFIEVWEDGELVGKV